MELFIHIYMANLIFFLIKNSFLWLINLDRASECEILEESIYAKNTLNEWVIQLTKIKWDREDASTIEFEWFVIIIEENETRREREREGKK